MAKNTTNGNGDSDLYLTHVVIDGKRVPFTREIALQFSLNAHLLSLGNPKRAAEMLAEAQRAGNNGNSLSNGSNGANASSVSNAGTVA
jgi:hypothetical protein